MLHRKHLTKKVNGLPIYRKPLPVSLKVYCWFTFLYFKKPSHSEVEYCYRGHENEDGDDNKDDNDNDN